MRRSLWILMAMLWSMVPAWAQDDSVDSSRLVTLDSIAALECRAELQVVEQQRQTCKKLFTSYIQQAIEGSLRIMMGGFVPEGKDAIVKRYQSQVASQMPIDGMKVVLSPCVDATVATINGSRKAIIERVAGRPVKSGYGVKAFRYAVTRHVAECPVNDMLVMQQLQRQVNWRTIGLKPDKVVTKGTASRLLRGQDLLDPAAINKNEDTKKVGPTVNRIARQLAWYVSKSVYKTVDEVFDFVGKKIKESQPQWSSKLKAAGR